MTYPPYGAAAPAQPANGLGTSSFVLGIIALSLSFIPILGWFTSPVAFVGLGVGLGNLGRLKSGRATNKAQTWIGIGLSTGAIVVYIAYIAIVVASVSTTSQ